jgi:hypothetical protein
VILGELRAHCIQGCDFKGFAGGGSSRGTPDELLTRLILRTWGAPFEAQGEAVLHPYTSYSRIHEDCVATRSTITGSGAGQL